MVFHCILFFSKMVKKKSDSVRGLRVALRGASSLTLSQSEVFGTNALSKNSAL